jgi:hypothetical protein
VPTWLIIVLAAVVLVVAVFFVLGLVGTGRRERARDVRFREQLEEANAALATARAADRGWERANLENAARTTHMARHPGAQIREMHLIQVVDRPGTEEDQARFRCIDADGDHDILLGRSGDEWVELSP